MNPILYYILIRWHYLVVILLWGWTIFWFRRHNISILTSEFKNGSFGLRVGRYRLVKGRLFHLIDIFRISPIIPLVPNGKRLEDYIISKEGLPVIGTNKHLRLKAFWDKEDKIYQSVPFLLKIDSNIIPEINDYKFSWSLETNLKLWEETKVQTKADVIAKIAVPMGLIILAMFIFIMAPKILQELRPYGVDIAQGALSSLKEALQGFRPG